MILHAVRGDTSGAMIVIAGTVPVNAEALPAHFAGPHMRVFREQLPRLVAGAANLRRHEVALAAAM